MIPANVSSSGSLVSGRSRRGIALLTGADLQPGSRMRAEVTIVNVGALPARFRLFEVDATNGFAPGVLGFFVNELRPDGDRRVYLGEMGGFPPEGVDLGRFEGGESRTYRFTVFVPRKVSAEELGASAGATYEWSAVSDGGE